MTSKYLTFAQLLEAIIHESKNCGGKLFAPARKKNLIPRPAFKLLKTDPRG